MEQDQHVHGIAIADRSWRATYGSFDDSEESGMRITHEVVIGWACLGEDVWPVRVDPLTGRGVLAGSALDPDRESLLAVMTAGREWTELPGMDERIRDTIRQGVSAHDENED